MLPVAITTADLAQWWAVFAPADATSAWTMVLALGTIALAIVACFGLRSLSLARTETRNRATRESVQCAVDRCNEMARELLPLYTEIMANLAARKVALFVTDPAQVSFEEMEEVQKINSAIAWVGKLEADLLTKTVQLINGLECWSMSFTHNPSLADEKFAFEPCSTVFCQMVMGLYPSLLTHRRTNPASGPFQNVVTLFTGWYARKAQGPMFEQLKRLQSDGSKLPLPIGA